MKKETLEEAQKQQFNYDNLHDAKEISSRIKVVETLEEALRSKFIHNPFMTIIDRKGFIQGGIFGAKWQQERSYSEEEVLNILDIILSEYRDSLKNKTDFYPALRFEQFKKK